MNSRHVYCHPETLQPTLSLVEAKLESRQYTRLEMEELSQARTLVRGGALEETLQGPSCETYSGIFHEEAVGQVEVGVMGRLKAMALILLYVLQRWGCLSNR